MLTEQKVNRSAQLINGIFIILILGSFWALSEAALGGSLRKMGFPYRAGLLTGIGFGLMGIMFGILKRPLMLIGVALVAVLGKQLAVPILHISIMCKANSCVAVILEGLALTGTLAIVGNMIKKSEIRRMLSGGSAALIASAAFYYIGMHVAPCRYLLSFNHPGGLISFLTVEGLVWAAFSAISFPVGYWIGDKIRGSLYNFTVRKPLIYYASSSAIVVLFWVGNAILIMKGF